MNVYSFDDLFGAFVQRKNATLYAEHQTFCLVRVYQQEVVLYIEGEIHAAWRRQGVFEVALPALETRSTIRSRAEIVGKLQLYMWDNDILEGFSTCGVAPFVPFLAAINQRRITMVKLPDESVVHPGPDARWTYTAKRWYRPVRLKVKRMTFDESMRLLLGTVVRPA